MRKYEAEIKKCIESSINTNKTTARSIYVTFIASLFCGVLCIITSILFSLNTPGIIFLLGGAAFLTIAGASYRLKRRCEKEIAKSKKLLMDFSEKK